MDLVSHSLTSVTFTTQLTQRSGEIKTSKEKKNMSSKKTGNKGGTTSKFKGIKGDEEALGYHVFDYGKANSQNQFNKTFEAIISHIGQTYPQPGNAIKSLCKEKEIDIANIPVPNYEEETGEDAASIRAKKNKNRALDVEYVEAVKAQNKKKETLKSNLEKAYSLVWGQCTLLIQAQLKKMSRYNTITRIPVSVSVGQLYQCIQHEARQR